MAGLDRERLDPHGRTRGWGAPTPRSSDDPLRLADVYDKSGTYEVAWTVRALVAERDELLGVVQQLREQLEAVTAARDYADAELAYIRNRPLGTHLAEIDRLRTENENLLLSMEDARRAVDKQDEQPCPACDDVPLRCAARHELGECPHDGWADTGGEQ